MNCVICTQQVREVESGYECTHCSLILSEHFVKPKKRPIITHFEESQ